MIHEYVVHSSWNLQFLLLLPPPRADTFTQGLLPHALVAAEGGASLGCATSSASPWAL